HHEQQHQRGEHVDDALPGRAGIGPDQVDGDVGAAIARGGDAPEDQDAEQHAPDVEGIGDRIVERIAQQHREKDIQRDDADEAGRYPFDRVDETIHRCAIQDDFLELEKTAAEKVPPPALKEAYDAYCVSALYLASCAFNSLMAASGSTSL